MIANIQAVVRGNDGNIRATLENLRIATENLYQLTDRVKQHPRNLGENPAARGSESPEISFWRHYFIATAIRALST